MDEKEDSFLKELLAAFRVEAAEHLEAITSGLLELERASAPAEQASIAEAIFRETHSLKGAARAVNMADVEAICQPLESAFRALKRGEVPASPELFDTLHHAVDSLVRLLSFKDGEPVAVSSVVQQLAALQPLAGESGNPAERRTPGERNLPPAVEPPAEKQDNGSRSGRGDLAPSRSSRSAPDRNLRGRAGEALLRKSAPSADMVRMPADRLDRLFLQAEELLSLRPPASQRASELHEAIAMLEVWRKEWTRIYSVAREVRRFTRKEDRSSSRRLPVAQAARLLEFLDWSHGQMEALEDKLQALARSTDRDNRSLAGMVDHLLEEMKGLLMLPSSSLLELLPKLVRDLSRDQGKEVDLVLEGGDVQVDKRILQEMKDPLIHLLRNCVDHGIEKPEERERAGKPRRGTITVALSQAGGNRVELAVSDDGAGIDPAEVRAAAAKRGVGNTHTLDDRAALSLIFRSEVSTSPTVDGVSGRGLGLAIVRERVEKLGGTISVETRLREGATFRMILPVTLATFRGIFVEAAGRLFVVPTLNVERVARIRQEAVKTVENRETVLLNEHTLPLVRLRDLLQLPEKEEKVAGSGFVSVLVVRMAEKRIAFGVDRVLSEQEVLVRGLGKQLSRLRNIAGATVLGSGEVVPILSVQDLVESATRAAFGPQKVEGGMGGSPPRPRAGERSLLVVEDSITSRMLLKNILESAGYRVKTAVDGVDAFALLRTEKFDGVVSDVQMPRMDGFDLTAKIRADKRLADMPVVLVTSMESREDRERGIDVGANGYIVKSSFDQSNLLAILQRLL